jgi:uncharacterized protein (DUF849 family)
MNGRESLDSEDVAHTLLAIRRECPEIPIGISTSASIVADPVQRYQLVSRWEIRPDYVSVNLHEAGALQLIQLVRSKGIGVEAGVWNAIAAEWLVKSQISGDCLRILIEAQEATVSAAVANAQAIEAVLDRAGIQTPRLLHGENGPAWGMVISAIARGYDTRVGFEDMLTLPDGTTAESNGDILRAASALIGRHLPSSDS